MRLKRHRASTPAARGNDLDLPAIVAVTRDLIGADTIVRPLWDYETGDLEAVEVRSKRAIAHIPGILSQLAVRVTTRLSAPWTCERDPHDPDTIRIAKAGPAALAHAGLATIRTTLTAGAASLGNPQVHPSYAPDGNLEAIDIEFSSRRKVGDDVLTDFTTRAMPGDWHPSWTDTNTLRLTPALTSKP
jgi:hypothetical protein